MYNIKLKHTNQIDVRGTNQAKLSFSVEDIKTQEELDTAIKQIRSYAEKVISPTKPEQ